MHPEIIYFQKAIKSRKLSKKTIFELNWDYHIYNLKSFSLYFYTCCQMSCQEVFLDLDKVGRGNLFNCENIDINFKVYASEFVFLSKFHLSERHSPNRTKTSETFWPYSLHIYIINSVDKGLIFLPSFFS